MYAYMCVCRYIYVHRCIYIHTCTHLVKTYIAIYTHANLWSSGLQPKARSLPGRGWLSWDWQFRSRRPDAEHARGWPRNRPVPLKGYFKGDIDIGIDIDGRYGYRCRLIGGSWDSVTTYITGLSTLVIMALTHKRQNTETISKEKSPEISGY